jgi:hypothetical protein
VVNRALTTGVDAVDVDVDGDVVGVDGDVVGVDGDVDFRLDFALFVESSASRVASAEIDSTAGLFASVLSVSADTTADTASMPG